MASKPIKPINPNKANFELFRQHLKRAEGGYQQLSNDDGNYNSLGVNAGTNHGISARTYEGVLGRPPTASDMKNLTYHEAVQIYQDDYWDRNNLSDLESQAVANTVADMLVNAGGSGSILASKTLKKFGVDVKSSSRLSKEAVNAINSVDPENFVEVYNTNRLEHYRKIVEKDPDKASHLPSWINRTQELGYASNDDYLASYTPDEYARDQGFENPANIAEDYLDSRKTILAADNMTQIEKQQRLADLDRKYAPNADIINEEVNQRNEASREEYNKQTELQNQFENVYDRVGDFAVNNNGSVDYLIDSDEAQDFMKSLEAMGVKSTDIFDKAGPKLHGERLGQTKVTFNANELTRGLAQTYKDITGDDKISTDMFDINKEEGGVTRIAAIDADGIKRNLGSRSYNPIARLSPSSVQPSTGDGGLASGTSANDDSEEGGEVTPENETSAFLSRQQSMLDASIDGRNSQPYDASNYRRELPTDALVGMALGLIGNEQAKNADIPLRTEQLSSALESYKSDLARKSQEGLPVEIEAAMKNQLADAYQGGLNNIVNASAGNRATVLGNQGQLEVARNKGLVDMQIADYEAKQAAFQQYGQMLQYENDFNARRDAANHQIQYQQGMQDRAEGKQLATAGMAQLMEGIRYQKENGPGSANHMYKSKILYDMFGFDPGMKDDGSGTQKGTRSYFDKQGEELTGRRDRIRDYNTRFAALSPEEQQIADQQFKENPGLASIEGYFSQRDENTRLAQERPQEQSPSPQGEGLSQAGQPYQIGNPTLTQVPQGYAQGLPGVMGSQISNPSHPQAAPTLDIPNNTEKGLISMWPNQDNNTI